MTLFPLVAFSRNFRGAGFRHLIAMIGIALSFSSCSPHALTVQTRYLSHEHLASYQIGTPDPALDHPDIGERLLIQWSLSSCQFGEQTPQLHLTVRFHNHQEQEIRFPLGKARGYYQFDLLNEYFCKKGGILTYLAEIRSGDCVIASWKHPLWTPLITFEAAQ